MEVGCTNKTAVGKNCDEVTISRRPNEPLMDEQQMVEIVINVRSAGTIL